MKVLITGANGYLGSSLRRDLSEKFAVQGTYGTKLKQFLLPMDVTKEDQVISTLRHEKPDVIIHCVGISGKFKDDPEYATHINIEGTRNIVRGAQEVNASLAYISSAAVFNGRDGPFTEDDLPRTEDRYGQTKIEAERIVQASGLSRLIIRPSLIVGEAPYGMENKFSGQLARAVTSGVPLDVDNEWRFAPSYTHHIGDVITWWINNQEQTNLLHVVSSETTTKLQYAHTLCRELGIDPSLFQDKQTLGHSGDNILDASRLRVLGAPTISLQEIVNETASEIRNPRTPEGVYRRGKEY